MPDFANPRRFVSAVKILVLLSTEIVRLPPCAQTTAGEHGSRSGGSVQHGPCRGSGSGAVVLGSAARRGGDGGNPAGNGFHQNGLEGIQGSERDELCLPRTDVC